VGEAEKHRRKQQARRIKVKIIVLMKQVPEMERVKFDNERGVIDRNSAGVEVNPFDLNALEAAVRIKEERGACVTALSMGPPRAERVLREAIARGADEGVLITDRQFGGSDTIATSAALASAIRRIGDFDLIIAGEMTVDGDTAQVGPQTAELLNLPHATNVQEILSISEKSIELVSGVWMGSYRKQLRFPALITVTKDINTPRLPSFRRMIEARKAELLTLGAAELLPDFPLERPGLLGSPTRVKKIIFPEATYRKGRIYRNRAEEAVEDIVELCREKHLIEGASND
jgi:electron transfer flavoprotein beta subunit